MSQYQTSNELVGNLNEDDGIIVRGDVVITPSASGTGYFGTATVDLEAVAAIIASPCVEVYEFPEPQAPGYAEEIVPTPRSQADTSTGALDFYSTFSLNKGAKSDAQLLLTISFWSRTQPYPRTFYYLVKRIPISDEDIFTP